jgi:hypothetical protein
VVAALLLVAIVMHEYETQIERHCQVCPDGTVVSVIYLKNVDSHPQILVFGSADDVMAYASTVDHPAMKEIAWNKPAGDIQFYWNDFIYRDGQLKRRMYENHIYEPETTPTCRDA